MPQCCSKHRTDVPNSKSGLGVVAYLSLADPKLQPARNGGSYVAEHCPPQSSHPSSLSHIAPVFVPTALPPLPPHVSMLPCLSLNPKAAGGLLQAGVRLEGERGTGLLSLHSILEDDRD